MNEAAGRAVTDKHTQTIHTQTIHTQTIHTQTHTETNTRQTHTHTDANTVITPPVHAYRGLTRNSVCIMHNVGK